MKTTAYKILLVIQTLIFGCLTVHYYQIVEEQLSFAIMQETALVPAIEVPLKETVLFMMNSPRCEGRKEDQMSPAGKIILAEQIDRILNKAGGKHIEKESFILLMCQESKYRTNLRSSSSAVGISQMILSTAQMEADRLKLGKITIEDLYNPEISITLGYSHYRYLLNLNRGNIARSFAFYNGGPEGKTSKNMKVGMIGVPETDAYVTTIFDMMEEKRIAKDKSFVSVKK